MAIDEQGKIFVLDAPLYVEVYCYGCKKMAALSNTHEVDGRRFCFNCYARFYSYQPPNEPCSSPS